MRLLLDTHVLLWALAGSPRLSTEARTYLNEPRNVVLFSAVSIWEIAIKASKRRSDFHAPPAVILDEALAAGFEELPVRSSVALQVETLPWRHKDPFDRLLIAQAMAEPATLLTADPYLEAYSELVVLV